MKSECSDETDRKRNNEYSGNTEGILNIDINSRIVFVLNVK